MDYHAARDRVLWHLVGLSSDERHPAGSRWWFDNHGREPADLVVFQIILAGTCIFRTPEGDREVHPGQAFLFCYDEPTAYGRPLDKPTGPGAAQSIHTAHICFGGAGLRPHWDVLRARFGPIVNIGTASRVLGLIRDIETAFARDRFSDRRAHSPTVHAFVMRLFDEIEAAAAEGLSPVERAVDALLRAPLSGHSLKQVAHQHGVTREHLTRTFAERVGQPPATWLREARLQRALELLRATELPIETVALQAGFASTRTLARLVQQETGVPPGRLRQSSR